MPLIYTGPNFTKDISNTPLAAYLEAKRSAEPSAPTGYRVKSDNDVSHHVYGDENVNNAIYGNGGNDFLYGASRGDWLTGGAGADTMFGYGGNDTLVLWSGSDEAHGGEGQDAFLIGKLTAADHIEMWGGSDVDTYRFLDGFQGHATIEDFNTGSTDNLYYDKQDIVGPIDWDMDGRNEFVDYFTLNFNTGASITVHVGGLTQAQVQTHLFDI